MKIEVMNINFALKKLQHITSAGVKDVKMHNNKVDSMPACLAYIEEYADQNGFDVLNAISAGPTTQFFLVKK